MYHGVGWLSSITTFMNIFCIKPYVVSNEHLAEGERKQGDRMILFLIAAYR